MIAIRREPLVCEPANQCHRFDVETPIEETMEALTVAVRSGKARHIGFSECTPEQWRRQAGQFQIGWTGIAGTATKNNVTHGRYKATRGKANSG